ncbi:MAG: hypothetical protein O7C98_11015 [Planctomycetota bacterium]|nr:hypothetical protein [Planctomycetota bacterium]
MPNRLPRNDEPNAVFHMTGRVNWKVWHLGDFERGRIFFDELTGAADAFGVDLLALVLMSNHFHLVTRSPDKAVFARHTSRRTRCRHRRPYPKRHQNSRVISQFARRLRRRVGARIHANLETTGRFWDGELYARRIDDPLDLLHTIAYDHRNPVRAGIVRRAESYERSSAAWWAGGPGPVRVCGRGKLPFDLKIESFREELIAYQESRMPDDLAAALAAHGRTEWDPDWPAALQEELSLLKRSV